MRVILGRTALVKFQLAATRRRLARLVRLSWWGLTFQLAATRRRLVDLKDDLPGLQGVSTRSHAKAAGWVIKISVKPWCRFNSQPREGGWMAPPLSNRGGAVSTRSHAKAAGLGLRLVHVQSRVSTRSHAKAAG